MNREQYQLESWAMTKKWREYRRAKMARRQNRNEKKRKRLEVEEFGYFVKDQDAFDDWLLQELNL